MTDPSLMQYKSGYERVDAIVKTRPFSVPLARWVWNRAHAPQWNDTDAFKDGYDLRAEELGVPNPRSRPDRLNADRDRGHQ